MENLSPSGCPDRKLSLEKSVSQKTCEETERGIKDKNRTSGFYQIVFIDFMKLDDQAYETEVLSQIRFFYRLKVALNR